MFWGHEEAPVDLGNLGGTAKLHGTGEFFPQDRHRTLHTGRAGGGQAIKRGPADEHGIGAKGQGLEDIAAAPDAAIQINRVAGNYRPTGSLLNDNPGSVLGDNQQPGHTGYMVESDGESLLIWGDICHAQELQFPHPEVTVSFDVDGEAAIATRRRVLGWVATDRLLVAGMHIHFPGFLHVVRNGDGFEGVPERWQYEMA